MRILSLTLTLCLLAWRSDSRSVVYTENNLPSLLYINNAPGKAQVTSSRDGTSDIIQLILYPASEKPETKRATAIITSNDVNGVVNFEQKNIPVGDTTIWGNITGLTPGDHGFHIHALGDLTNGCKSAAGHYNPYMRSHGSPQHLQRHVGDLGNIFADATGTATFKMVDPLVTLVGPRAVVGRAVVVHQGEDDLGEGGQADSLSTGAAGGRVACAVIGVA